MRAALVRTTGAPDTIEIADVPTPEPGPGEIRIAVAAAAVNPVDLATRNGYLHGLGLITLPAALGWDVAGVVDAVGEGADLPVGTRVAAVHVGFDKRYGGYGEMLVVPASAAAVVPDGLDLVAAATVPLNGLTASQALDLLGPGTLLVTGAAGAVGGYALRLAADRGWRVTGLGRPGDEEFVRGTGAAFTTSLEGEYDVVLDAIPLGEPALALVRDGGTFVGVHPANLPAVARDVRVLGVSGEADRAVLADLLARTATGALPARVHDVLPLAAAGKAHALVEAGGVRGRVVLVP